MNVFCLIRAHSAKNFKLLLESCSFSNIYLIQEEPILKSGNTLCLYPNNSIKHIDLSCYNIDFEDIILRDRLLRKIDRDKAVHLVSNVYSQIILLFEKYKPDLVVGQLVDFYILDILYRVADLHNVKSFSFMCGFIDNTFCNSRYGELSYICDSKINIQEHYEKELQPQFVSNIDNAFYIKDLLHILLHNILYINKFFLNIIQYYNYNHFVRCSIFSFYHSNVTIFNLGHNKYKNN